MIIKETFNWPEDDGDYIAKFWKEVEEERTKWTKPKYSHVSGGYNSLPNKSRIEDNKDKVEELKKSIEIIKDIVAETEKEIEIHSSEKIESEKEQEERREELFDIFDELLRNSYPRIDDFYDVSEIFSDHYHEMEDLDPSSSDIENKIKNLISHIEEELINYESSDEDED